MKNEFFLTWRINILGDFSTHELFVLFRVENIIQFVKESICIVIKEQCDEKIRHFL